MSHDAQTLLVLLDQLRERGQWQDAGKVFGALRALGSSLDVGQQRSLIEFCEAAWPVAPEAARAACELAVDMGAPASTYTQSAVRDLARLDRLALDREPETAEQHHARAIQLRTTHAELEHLARAVVQADCLACHRAAVGQAPANATYWIASGKSLRHFGKQEQAGECYERALAHAESVSDANVARIGLAAVLVDQGSRERARRLCDEVLQTDRHNPMAHNVLARIASERGERDRAKELYRGEWRPQ